MRFSLRDCGSDGSDCGSGSILAANRARGDPLRSPGTDTRTARMRITLGILIGALLAAGVLAGFGYLLMRLHPLPAGFDPLSLRALANYVAAA
ncbi:MAG TPA: hypothetical protein VHF86_00735, partial [Xanthomonadaceae bacterium]|nr:hypothetical protein [Xanthomonadaceae bacterium]